MIKAGRVFSLLQSYPPIPGCTVSGELISGVRCFSMASGTDISAESYPIPTLMLGLSGETVLTGEGGAVPVCPGSAVIRAADKNTAVSSGTDSVYIEADIGKEHRMNSIVKTGEVFKLAELVPYQEGKIVNMDVVSGKTMKFVVMSFDAGCALSEHAAPGEAVIFALDGEGVIGYEGAEHPIKAGENFVFAKGGRHSVKAKGRFKMALLLTLG
ncbi:MAG: cupin domain-containing protein [Oscillospiraceae bacterium]|nr:cupin domain-containing protein [Oscillospiraceae bacterium]